MHPEDLESPKNEVRPEDLPEELAVLPVSDAVIYPHMMVPLVVSDPKLVRLAEDVMAGARCFGAFTQRPLPDEDAPSQSEDSEGVFRVGTAVAVQKTMRFPDGSRRFLGRGIGRYGS